MKSKAKSHKNVASFTEKISDLIEELSDEEAAACAGGILSKDARGIVNMDVPFTVGHEMTPVALALNTPVQNVEINNTPGASVRCWSDRNQKEHFAPVDVQEILGKVATLPIETWNYKEQNATIRHIGPMAQDFAAAFDVGEDNRFINVVDANGVAFAAIQALYQQLQEKKAEISTMRAELDALKQIIETRVYSSFDTPQAELNCK